MSTIEQSFLAGEKEHATYSASGSERWLNCPGSITLSDKAPPQPDGPYAEEGTRAHACLEFLLKNRKKIKPALALARKKYPEEMIVNALIALDYVARRLQALPGAEVFVETKVKLPVSEPDQGGTCDIIIMDLFGELEVIDYKYGAGVVVSPVENSQAIYYGLSVAHKYDYNFSSVKLTIIQPRAAVGGEIIRSWDTTIDNLITWRGKFEVGIKACKKPDAKLIPSAEGGKDYCRFCPAKIICPAIGTRALARAKIDFAPLTGEVVIPKVKTVTVENLPKILKAADALETWITAIREHAFHLLQRGEKVPGFKLVAKRSSRKWTDQKKAEALAYAQFGNKVFNPKSLFSPAQMEKLGLLEKKFTEGFASSVSSGVTMVPDSDKRLAVCPAIDDFKDDGELKKISPQKVAKAKNALKRMKR